ncbi:MAG: ABC transporter ATP-binding protein, partial [Gemmatimonadales bacterium]
MPQRLRRGQRSWRWALRDVTLRVDPGGSVGIVGVNGSGKSTLLKILSRVMYPYAGRVEAQGRLAGLIDIRAGIHPDLTGEENVYLYGMLLGLSRGQVVDRFEEIVAFAELQDSIRGQVKYYSTGMQMRLGFSVAALLEPDILLVDEVLTVGDAAFQQKCLDRMQLLLGRGTTLVLVSHDLATIEATCARAVWLHEGRVRGDGAVRETLGAYRGHIEQLVHAWSARSDVVKVDGVRVVAPGNGGPRSLGPLEIQTTLRSPAHQTGVIHLGVSEGLSTPIFVGRRDVYLKPGEMEVRCHIGHLPLPRG